MTVFASNLVAMLKAGNGAYPTSDGVITGCTVYKAHGGFVVGSEMSGGVRNIFVSGCTFLGSDIGLRFKTTRGRGGAVEDIYISDINMTDIPAEAILFDMYYNGKEAAEALKNPAMEKLPVTEETPAFRKIYIQNIACLGAKHAIYVQGLPEMNVQEVHIENSIFHTKHGFTCVEGDGIWLKNVVMETGTADPAMRIINSRNLSLENVQISGKAEKGLQIDGKQSSAIRLRNSNAETLGIQFGEGVNQRYFNKAMSMNTLKMTALLMLLLLLHCRLRNARQMVGPYGGNIDEHLSGLLLLRQKQNGSLGLRIGFVPEKPGATLATNGRCILF